MSHTQTNNYLAEKARLPFVRIRHVPLTLSVPDLADWTKHDQRSTLVCRCASQLHVPSWPDSFRRRHVHPMIGVTKPKGSVAWGSCEAILDWVDSVPSLRSPLTTIALNWERIVEHIIHKMERNNSIRYNWWNKPYKRRLDGRLSLSRCLSYN